MYRRVSPIALALAPLLLGISSGLVAAVDYTRVKIGFPDPSGWPRSALTVEIGKGLAMTVPAGMGGGGASVELDRPTVVRVRRLPSCEVIARFVVQPGGSYKIDVARDGTLELKDYSATGQDSGPGIELHRPTCPALPDTSTAPAGTRSEPLDLLLLFTSVVAVAFVALAYRTRSGAASAPAPP